MRILHIVKSLKKNGTETFIMNVFRCIDRNKFKFDFLVFQDNKEGYYQEAKELGANIYYIPARKKNPFLFRKRLNNFFSEHSNEYDIVHMHDMSFSSLAPLISAKKNNIPVRIFHLHGSNCEGIHNKCLHRLHKPLIPSVATNYFACSKGALKWGYSNSKIEEKALLINNGIDLNSFKFNLQERERVRKELGLNETDDILIHIGSFNKVKNHHFLLEVFQTAKKHNHNLKLVLIGDGVLFTNTKIQAKNLGIEKDIFFMGRQDKISSFLSAADCFILPSFHEGLPMVALEAQASGLPLIVSTGVSEESKVSDKFKQIDLNDSKEVWANAINNFIKMKSISRDIPINMNKFSIENTVKILSDIYSIK